jgi:hypothetical protein
MGIKFGRYILLLFSSLTFGQEQTELEFKYKGQDLGKLQKFLLTNERLGDFQLNYHGMYSYFDIYFDTPSQVLMENGLSLRMRYQLKPGEQDSIRFLFQLKSEMTSAGGKRYEMDETELEFYLLEHRGEQVTLSDLLMNFFSESPDQALTNQQQAIAKSLQAWMKQKAGGSVIPFLGLKHLNPQLFTNELIGTLQPTCVGVTSRRRVNIYMTYTEQEKILRNLAQMKRPKAEIPPLFRENSDAFWLMEGTFDQSYFHRINHDGGLEPVKLTEFEVEQKYAKSDGLDLIRAFDRALREQFDLETELRSKYRQVMDAEIK